MHRSLVIRLTAIIVILAATAAALAAQGRGFRGGGVSVFRGAPAVRSVPGPAFFSRPGRPIVASPVAPFVSSPVAPPLRGGPFFFGGPSHTFGRFPRTIVVPSVGGYYSPYIWPTTIYGYGGPAYYPYPASVYSEPAYASPAASPAVSQGEVDLAYQVGRLSQEIEQLRQQQTITSYTQPPAPSQVAPQQRTPTVLVFRDGHRMEMQNYAIVGQTLWVFDERAATKIPLSDLDLDATQKENRGSGFRFPLQEK